MTHRLRVLALIDSLTWGGAEMLLADFADGAPAAGLELAVGYLQHVDGSPASGRLVARGITPHHLHGTLLRDPRGWMRVAHRIRCLRPDVVHTHLGTADLIGGLAARALGIPSCSTVHVMDWRATGRELAKERLMAAARRRAARVIAVSDAAREAYLATGWDLPEHVVTIQNGTAVRPRVDAGARVRHELGLAPNDIVLTMLTVLREGKGHDIAAAAVTQLRRRDQRVRLLVAGEGPYRPEVERLLAPLGSAAVLAGQRNDVSEILDATDVLLHPTRIDALPTALIEAMAAGVPSVATAVGGVPEIVVDGVTGVLVAPPPDAGRFALALAPLVADHDLRRRLGDAGRRRHAQAFTTERWALRVRALYEQILDEGR